MQVFLIVLVVVIAATSIWVVFDGVRLGVRRGGLGGGLLDFGIVGWFVACEVLWIIAFPLYMALRRRYVALEQKDVHDGSVSAARASVPAAWYPDPTDPSSQRWWDGENWTEHTI